MFTGIVEEIGVLIRRKDRSSSCTLTIGCKKVLENTKIGDSIAVNGTCLTVTAMTDHSFDADVTPETMRRTSFSIVRTGSPLNLERALRVGDRLGGHMVSGHVDCVGKIISMEKEGNAVNITFSVPDRYMRYCPGERVSGCGWRKPYCGQTDGKIFFRRTDSSYRGYDYPPEET